MKATTISIAIQKGGSGKTTTAVNLAAYLRNQGKNVLLVDLDPQANLTQSVGLPDTTHPTIYHMFKRLAAGETPSISDSLQRSGDLDVIPASLDLAMSEMELVSVFGREKLLSQHLKEAKKEYDVILVDCPPAMGMLTINALTASDGVIIPLQAEFLPMKGLQHFMKSMEMVRQNLNPDLEVLGLLLTKFDQRKIMNQRVARQLEEEYKVFNTRIRTNIALAQAQEQGMDIFSFDPRSHGAEDYAGFGKEVLERLT